MSDKVCSDFDADCQHVENPLQCWIGKTIELSNGDVLWTPIADGYCPLLRKQVKKLEAAET